MIVNSVVAGGLPVSWKQKAIAPAWEGIQKNDPIEYRRYMDIESSPGEAVSLPFSVPTGYITVSSDGRYVCFCSGAGVSSGKKLSICLINNNEFVEVYTETWDHDNRMPKFTADSKRLVVFVGVSSGSGVELHVYNVENPSNIYVELTKVILSGASGYHRAAVAFDIHPNSVYIALRYYSYNQSSKTYYYSTLLYKFNEDHSDITSISSIPTIDGKVSILKFSPGGNYLLIGYSYDSSYTSRNTLQINSFNTETEGMLDVTEDFSLTGGVDIIEFHPSGEFLVIGYSDKYGYVPRFYEVGSNFQLNLITVSGLTPSLSGQELTSLAFSPDGNYFVWTVQNVSDFPTDQWYRMFKILNKTSYQLLTQFNTAINSALYNAKFDPKGNWLYLQGNLPQGVAIFPVIAQDFVRKFTNITQDKYYSLNSFSFYGIGMALESKLSGENIKVNLFPAMNDIMGQVYETLSTLQSQNQDMAQALAYLGVEPEVQNE